MMLYGIPKRLGRFRRLVGTVYNDVTKHDMSIEESMSKRHVKPEEEEDVREYVENWLKEMEEF